MSTILTSSAVTVVTNVPLTSTLVSPSVRLRGTRTLSSYELTLTTPDVGTCSIALEYSTNNGTVWVEASRDSFTAQVPKVGGSSSVRFFTRPALPNDSNTLLRARVTDLTGSPWLATIKVES